MARRGKSLRPKHRQLTKACAVFCLGHPGIPQHQAYRVQRRFQANGTPCQPLQGLGALPQCAGRSVPQLRKVQLQICVRDADPQHRQAAQTDAVSYPTEQRAAVRGQGCQVQPSTPAASTCWRSPSGRWILLQNPTVRNGALGPRSLIATQNKGMAWLLSPQNLALRLAGYTVIVLLLSTQNVPLMGLAKNTSRGLLLP